MSYILDALQKAANERQRDQATPLDGLSLQGNGIPFSPSSERRTASSWGVIAGLTLLVLAVAGGGAWWWILRTPDQDRVQVSAAPMEPVVTGTGQVPDRPQVPPPAMPTLAPVTPVAPVAPAAPTAPTSGMASAESDANVPMADDPAGLRKTRAAPTPPILTPVEPPAPTPAPPAQPAPPDRVVAPVARAMPTPPLAQTGQQPLSHAPAPTSTGAPAPLPNFERQTGLPKIAVSGAAYSANADMRMIIANGKVVKEGGEAAPGVVVEVIGARSAILLFQGKRYNINY